MKRHGHKQRSKAHGSGAALLCPVALSALMLAAPALSAQTGAPTLPQQIQQLTESMARAQAQIRESQRQLDEMNLTLKRLQDQMSSQKNAVNAATTVPTPDGTSTQEAATSSSLDETRERQAMQEAQISTQEQTKVESESKYPVKITGLLLFNGFVNTRGVDAPTLPTLALSGPGSTGATLRQTVLGVDAFGPLLFGAHSYADLRVDFDGSPAPTNMVAGYSGSYSGNATFLRLRTIHAGLQWEHTNAYLALDRPILSPDSPTSLATVAEPAMGWSGNLWTWNPQLGITHDIAAGNGTFLRLQAALIDTGAAPVASATTPTAPASGATPPSPAERSRWPGVETRIALVGSPTRNDASHIGLGGYFAPHTSPADREYDAWAGTLDTRLNLPAHLSLVTYFYRGAALGGLGGGAFKDYGYRPDPDKGNFYFRPFDDVGGWTQLKERINSRIELNAAFGMDNAFSCQVRTFALPAGSIYQNLARNRTYTGNVIFSPSSYLLFSLEYRRLASAAVTGSPASSDIFGIAAAYKF